MSIPTFSTEGSSLSVEGQRQLLSTRLRYARTQLKLTQAEFASQCGVSVPTYKRFELGTCDSLEVLLRVITIFNRTSALDLIFPAEVTSSVRPRTLLATFDRLQKKRKVQQQVSAANADLDSQS